MVSVDAGFCESIEWAGATGRHWPEPKEARMTRHKVSSKLDVCGIWQEGLCTFGIAKLGLGSPIGMVGAA